MSSPAITIPQATINNTIGAILLGGFFTAVLYGITCLQCFIFLQRNYSRGEKPLVITVWLLGAMGSAHLTFVVYSSYWYMVTNYANPRALLGLHWSIPVSIIVTATGDCMVRGWFAYRVWKLGKRNKLVTFPLCVLIAVIWIFSMVLEIKSLLLTDFSEAASLSWILYLVLSVIVFTDAYIAISLSIYLYKSRSRFNKRIDSLLTKLMLYVINTGVATSILSCACLISYVTMPNVYVFIGILFPLNQLYANSLLASFNARDWMRNGSDTENFVLSHSLSERSQNNAQNPVFANMHKEFQGATGSSVEYPLQVQIKSETMQSIA